MAADIEKTIEDLEDSVRKVQAHFREATPHRPSNQSIGPANMPKP